MKSVTARRTPDASRFEAGAFEQHAAGRGLNFGVFAAHHPRERYRPRPVADEQIVGIESSFDPIQRGHRLPQRRTTNNNLPAADPIDVIIQDWSKEVFTATVADTSISHHPEYGQPDSLQPLAHKGLFFASTEMAPKFGGFIEGALEAAEIVLDEL